MEEAGIFQLRSDYERETMMADEDKVFQKRIQLLFEHDRVIRSHAIYEASAIERMIESVIAWHFCSRRRTALVLYLSHVCQH